MRRNKKMLIIVLVVALIKSFVMLPVFATVGEDVVVSLQIDNPVMKVNGVQAEIDEGRNTVPVIIGSRTLVPIRAIVEAFGGTVFWDADTRTVTLSLKDDIVKLTIESNVAYHNEKATILDATPTVINDRTMIPLRFVAESFNLGVAWEEGSRTITVIRNGFDDSEYVLVKSMVSEYSGKPYIQINNNKPFFKEYEIIEGSFEFYADLDELGRCDVAMASVGKDIMPTEERKSISSVTPTGWINAQYDVVSGGYLYNRCHLIGYQLTGENANARNLITGTRYLNVDGMLPFENMIDDYVERTNNNVMYRSTPVFTENNLVCDGVLLEAYSVEDNGKGISFCVYCYNVQPQIVIEYLTGRSYLGNGEATEHNETSEITYKDKDNSGQTSGIYRTPTGKRYHFNANCGGKNSFAVSLDEALNAGLTPCAKCAD